MALQLTAHATQDWLRTTAVTIAKHEWQPNSPDLNLLHYHLWGQPSVRQTNWAAKITMSKDPSVIVTDR